MKSLSLTKAAVLIALAASAQAALAADGTVNFVGKLIDTPCSVSPNSANLTVPLGSVSTTSMNGGVKRSTPAKFTIDLLNCSPPLAPLPPSFTGTADASGNRLRVGVGEASGFATGVSIEIADSAGTPINLVRRRSPIRWWRATTCDSRPRITPRRPR